MLSHLWQRVINRLTGGGRKQPLQKQRRSRPLLEALEERLVPTNWFVSTQGADSNQGSQAAPFATIQHAVNVAASGDVIQVATGVYGYTGADKIGDDPRFNAPGNTGTISGTFLKVNPAVVLVYDKSLQILGGFDNGFTTLAPSTFRTFIDGGSVVRGVYVLDDNGGPSAAFNTPAGLDMEGFTVQACHASGEGGLAAPDNVNAFGAGMWVNTAARSATTQGNFLLKNMVFRGDFAQGNNTGGVGGSGAGAGVALRFVNSMTLDHVTFDTNLSQGGSGVNKGGDALGGAMHLDHSNVSGNTVTLYNNRAVSGGASGNGLDPNSNATADALGGAMAVQISSSATLQNVIALNNSLQGGNVPNGDAGAAFGGTFFVEQGTLSLSNADIRGCVIQGGSGQNPDTRGGLAGGGGIETLNSNLNLNQVQVINNKVIGGAGAVNAGSPGGGGLYLTRLGTSAANTVTILNTVIADNTVQFGASGNTNVGGGGGGIWLQGIAATITQSTIANNHFGANLFNGQAIVLLNDGGQNAASATISYSIIANHTNTNRAAALSVLSQSPNNAATLNQVLYANNTKDDNSDGVPSPAGVFNGLNTVTRAASAGFTSPGGTNFDYSISANSPAVNRATGSNATVDINNNPRTGVPDLGAYEAPAAPRARSSVALFDPETGIWQLRQSNAGGFFPDGPLFAYGSGGGNSKPVVGDWNGDGITTVGVVEVKTVDFSGNPFLVVNGQPVPVSVFELKNTNGPGVPDIIVPYGSFAAFPVAGNWDNNAQHIDHIGVVEIQNGAAVWKLKNSFSRGVPDITIAYGGPSSIPVVGDWNGDGVTTLGVVENNGGVLQWKLRNSFSQGAPDFNTPGQSGFAYGLATAVPITGDWDNNGTFTPGIYDFSKGLWQLRNENSTGSADAGTFTFGPSGGSDDRAERWIPFAGDFDGLG
jgi:hypothetical protein